jgi:hypothetical protein
MYVGVFGTLHDVNISIIFSGVALIRNKHTLKDLNALARFRDRSMMDSIASPVKPCLNKGYVFEPIIPSDAPISIIINQILD